MCISAGEYCDNGTAPVSQRDTDVAVTPISLARSLCESPRYSRYSLNASDGSGCMLLMSRRIYTMYGHPVNMRRPVLAAWLPHSDRYGKPAISSPIRARSSPARPSPKSSASSERSSDSERSASPARSRSSRGLLHAVPGSRGLATSCHFPRSRLPPRSSIHAVHADPEQRFPFLIPNRNRRAG